MRWIWVPLAAALGVAAWPRGQDGADDVRVALSRVAMKLREKAAPAVVAISVERTADPDGRGPRGKRVEHQEYYSRPKGPCTGTLMTKDGWILTSAFNVSGQIKSVTVRVQTGPKFGDLEAFSAKIVGVHKDKDMALLKIEPGKDLPVLERADLAAAKVGDLGFIVGRLPDPEQPTINFGILSAMHRQDGTHLQTDAELNYGNVGGPIVDARGRLVGVTCGVKPQAPWGQSGGVGFAYRADQLDALIETLKKGDVKPKEPPKPKAFLGIVSAEGAKIEGALAADVLQDSPAEKAGIKTGDIVIEFDGKAIKTPEDLQAALSAKKPKDKVKIKIKRPKEKEGEFSEHEFTVELDEEQEY